MRKAMKLLKIDILDPAHVFLFKNNIIEWKKWESFALWPSIIDSKAP